MMTESDALVREVPEADEAVRGIVMDIQRSAMHDGPGIRTTVFLKGCPLRCTWCHNPESQAFVPELAFDRGPSADSSAPGAVRLIGRETTVAEVMEEVMRDTSYYERSGGGITISGGEPMAQFAFTSALLRSARRRGIHTCLDTSGQAHRARFEAVYKDVDLFLYDFKDANPKRHSEFTGVANYLILCNLELLYERGARIILRCPLVPGVNDFPDHLEGIATLSARYPNLAGIDILPYHNMGRHKAEQIGRPVLLPHLENTDETTKRKWIEALAELGCTRAQLG
jgi:pyruvate formate lyase activating enzyme